MVDAQVRESAQRPRIVAVLVRVKGEGLGQRGESDEQSGDVAFDGAGIGPAESSLELGAPAALALGHAAAPAQLGVGEPIEEVALSPSGDMKQRGMKLTELEALERVESQGLGDRFAGPKLEMHQQGTA